MLLNVVSSKAPAFLKLKRYLCPNTSKKIVGFDFFDSEKLVESLSGQDAEAMKTLFEKRNYSHKNNHRDSFDAFVASCGFEEHEYELVSGDICKTASEYVSERPGARISLLYIDLDVEEPTYAALEALWPRVVKGGIVVFDEYAFHSWSEANGVDNYFVDKDVEIKSLDYICPTAYVVKK